MPNAVLAYICNREFVELQNDKNKSVKKIIIIITNKAFRSKTTTLHNYDMKIPDTNF